MPYTHFRYIGYRVPTAYEDNARQVVSGWYPGIENAPAVDMIPVPDNVPDDAQNRLRRLAYVVNLAYAQLQGRAIADEPDTLKVFVAPEFYFRPYSAGIGYDNNTYPIGQLTSIYYALRTMFSDRRLERWLIVCGTVMYNNLQESPRSKDFYYNTAVIVLGGNSVDINDRIYTVEKRAPSLLDGVPVVSGVLAAMSGDPELKLIMEGWSNMKNHLLSIDNVRVGVEVCLDHDDRPNCHVLRRTLIQERELSRSARKSVALHILTAGGMPIQPKSVAAKVNGYILRSDGMNGPEPRVQLSQITRYDPADFLNRWFGENPGPDTIGAIAQTNRIAQDYIVDIPPVGRIYNPPVPRIMTQSLFIYPRLQLPE
ncbi:MAG: hypothetical protein ACRDRS_12530 [Pseudonocardiaceae bacterium]